MTARKYGTGAGEETLSGKYSAYIREKVNQLLQVMGSSPLKPEELDDKTLLDLDPLGIIAGSFEQVLDHLKETNRELTITHESLQAIFDATGVGISIIDRDFRILKYNEKQRALLVDDGIGDVTGRYCHEVYCGKPSPDIDCPAVDTLETGKPVIIREAAKKGKHFQVVTTPFKDAEGTITGVIEVLLDISDTKRARDAEKEQRGFYLTEKSKLAAILQSLSEGLFVTDDRGTIVSFNNAARTITGYAEEEVLGLHCRKFFHMLAGGENVFPEEKGLMSREFSAVSRNNRQLTLSMSSVSLQDGSGRYSGRVYSFRDISEEKLRQENRYRTEKLAALGQLSAGIAHELNTPLGSILGYARLLMKEPDLSPDKRERLEIIAEQAIRGSAIIKRLLNFARQSAPELADMDINGVMSDSLKILGEEIEKRHITVTTDLGAVPLFRADKRQVEQVIINILLNALQAVNRHGQIRIRTFLKDHVVAIGISDNGPGIPRDMRTRIFDPFFTTKPIGEGTGLGLSICAGIVSAHGGAIQVDSEEGKGASFLITLPVHRNEERTS
jgi:two-component system NtrC family sensor kinase